jgi:hypothetical protein
VPPGHSRFASSSPRTPSEDGRDVVGERVGAAVIDILVLGFLFVVMAVLFGGAQSTTGTSLNDPSVHTTGTSASLSGLPFVLFLVLSFGYYSAAAASPLIRFFTRSCRPRNVAPRTRP